MSKSDLSKIKDAINHVTTMILEDWGMMMVDPAEGVKDIFSNDNKFFVSVVKFKGIVGGEYSIVCQQEFANILARNVLGLDEEPDMQDQVDALKEMANVLCGNMLTECYGTEAIFDLTPPEIREHTSSEVDCFFNDRTVCCMADDTPVAATFSVDSSS